MRGLIGVFVALRWLLRVSQERILRLNKPPLYLKRLNRAYGQLLRMLLVEGRGDPRLLHAQQIIRILMRLRKRVREPKGDVVQRLLVESQK